MEGEVRVLCSCRWAKHAKLVKLEPGRWGKVLVSIDSFPCGVPDEEEHVRWGVHESNNSTLVSNGV